MGTRQRSSFGSLGSVPVETLRQALEPVAHGVSDADGGERVARGSDADAEEWETWHR